MADRRASAPTQNDDGTDEDDSVESGDEQERQAKRPRTGRRALHNPAREHMVSVTQDLLKRHVAAASEPTMIDRAPDQLERELKFFEELSADSAVVAANLNFDHVEGAPSILDWWRDHSKAMPLIAQVARHILAIPATSAPSERVFSTAGRVSGRKRARMSKAVVQACVRQHELHRKRRVIFANMPSCAAADESDESDNEPVASAVS
jgi:hypothetical protein